MRAKHLKWNWGFMSKIEGRYNTEYPNLLAFHSPLYNVRAGPMLTLYSNKVPIYSLYSLYKQVHIFLYIFSNTVYIYI